MAKRNLKHVDLMLKWLNDDSLNVEFISNLTEMDTNSRPLHGMMIKSID